MVANRINGINIELLRWAFMRAGYNEEQAIIAFPLLAGWLSEDTLPTISQLQKFAAKFFVPFGYLFLQQIPEEAIPFPMFRGEAGQSDHFDVNVYDTVMNIQGRQEWLEEYFEENDFEPCPLVESIQITTPVNVAVGKLRKVLCLDSRWALGLASVEVAIGLLTQKLEDASIFTAFNGVVGNNTHRKLDVQECRGFALVNRYAPYVFVNNADSKYAQMFTLIHETAHIMLGVSAGHAGDNTFMLNDVESYCDKIAAEFLVPDEILHEMWNGDIKWCSRRFKVSEIVIARRAHDLGLLSDQEYRAFWAEYSRRPIEQKRRSGGDFYNNSVKKVGKLFAIHVRNAVNNLQLSYTEAYRLTGLYGKTYDHFMTNNI